MKPHSVSALLAVACLLAAACDAPGSSNPGGWTPPPDTGADQGTSPDTAQPDAALTDAGEPDSDSGPQADVPVGNDGGPTDTAPGDEGTEPPEDTGGPEDVPPLTGEPPAPKSYSGGTCPNLVAGGNTITSAGESRDVVVRLPFQPEGAGVLFLWHGFGDSGSNFSSAVGASSIANAYDVITVSADAILDPLESEKLAPYKTLARQMMGPMPPTWSIFDGPGIDLVLFDDLLACLDAQYGIDRSRVYTMGFSAGALWSTRLLLERSDYLAAALLWSGGLGSAGGMFEIVRFEYQRPSHLLPVLAASGGETDVWPQPQFALVSFEDGTIELRDDLRADGDATVHCDHGLGHTIPSDGLTWGLKFLFDHTWTPDGESPYMGFGGAGFPDYCDFPGAG